MFFRWLEKKCSFARAREVNEVETEGIQNIKRIIRTKVMDQSNNKKKNNNNNIPENNGEKVFWFTRAPWRISVLLLAGEEVLFL